VTGALYRLGRACARHHWIVIAAWLVAAVAIALVARAAGEQTNDNLTMEGTGSTRSLNLLQDHLPKQAYGTNPLVLKAKKGTLQDKANADAVASTVTSLKKAPHVVDAVSPLSQQGSAALAKDKKIGYVTVTLDEGSSDLTKEQAQTVIDAAAPARKAGLTVETGGYLGQAVSKSDTKSSEAIGLLAAVVILLFAFGTATAMFLPIVSALLGLVIALSLIRLLGHVVDVPTVAPTLATMIGLGVGIDYALFIVTRHKLQMRDGIEVRESIARATATAGGAVVFAGGTVVIALVSLLASGIPLIGTMGYSAAVAVVVAVLAATTLLPAMLGALDLKINALRVKLGRTHPDDHQPHGWARWARGVANRPWRSAVGSVVLLAILAAPVLHLRLGSQDNGLLPESTTARKAFDLISDGFGPGVNGPLLLSVRLGSPAKPDQKQLNTVDTDQKNLDAQQKSLNSQKSAQEQQATQQLEAQGVPPDQAPSQAKQKVDPKFSSQQKQLDSKQQQIDSQHKQAESPTTDSRLTTLQKDVKDTPGVKEVSPLTLDKPKTVAVFTAVPTTRPSARKTEDLVTKLRSSVIPKATKGSKTQVYVGGQTAGYIDLASRISDRLPEMILIVVGLSFLVLLLAFRSVLMPLKAAVANLLSVGAAYGVVTFVFQDGHGAKLIGLDGAIPIVSYVPLMMFAILFGLSMDYEVFLLTQIQEHHTRVRDTRRAVIEGLASTGRVITSAALIMVCVFASFVLSGNAVVKQFGIGLAVAIAIDATVVRCLFVPAVMTLLGERCWWLPRWLDRVLPRISVEGGEYFDKDAAPTLPPEPATAPQPRPPTPAPG
jgi:putative drug exporter of the RND superfamily